MAETPVPSQVFSEATPIEPLVEPVYPVRALAAKAGMATITVRLAIDKDGRVTNVSQSILGFTVPGPFTDDFRAAVEDAVRLWRFNPAEIHQVIYEAAPAGRASWRLGPPEKVETAVDVSFTFTPGGNVLPVRR